MSEIDVVTVVYASRGTRIFATRILLVWFGFGVLVAGVQIAAFSCQSHWAFAWVF